MGLYGYLRSKNNNINYVYIYVESNLFDIEIKVNRIMLD